MVEWCNFLGVAAQTIIVVIGIFEKYTDTQWQWDWFIFDDP